MPSSLEEGIFTQGLATSWVHKVGKTLLVLSHNQHHTHESRDLGKVQMPLIWGGWMLGYIPSNLSIVSKNSILGI